MSARPLVLSVFATFALGGPQVRFASLANHFGRRWRHAIVAMDGRYDCAARLSEDLDVSYPEVVVRRGAMVANLWPFWRVLRELRPDVVITHNWGSIEWAMASHGPGRFHHVHIEDGFGPEETAAQIPRRVLTRRAVLRHSQVVVPSLTLLDIASNTWRLPEDRVRYIPNGLDLRRFHPGDRSPAPTEMHVGTVAALRQEKNLARLLQAMKRLLAQDLRLRLTIVGDGPERAALEALTKSLGIGAAVTFTGAVQDPSALYQGFDLFALSSDTEQMPISVLEAMASGLSVVATDVGDVARMLSAENRPLICERDEAALAAVLRRAIEDEGLRRAAGAANRARAERCYDQLVMFQRYDELLASADRPALAGASS